MRRLFSTDLIPAEHRFRLWSEFCEQSFVRSDREKIDDGVFHASLEAADFGSFFITRTHYTPLKTRATKQTIRRQDSRPDSIFFNLKLSGRTIITQNDQTFVQNEGEIALHDTSSPFEVVHPESVSHINIELPREKLERMLGAARHYTGLVIGRSQPTANILKSFLTEFIRVREQLSSEMVERMSSIGIDLMVASIAERMSMETPPGLRGTVVVQRAKAHIEANLSNPELSPAGVAAAANVSLRYLQERFRERGRHISDWIWQRRLETAAQRLCDPLLMHLTLDALAYGCGFASQAHFSRRFKHRYDVSPSDYRRAALASAVERGPTPTARSWRGSG